MKMDENDLSRMNAMMRHRLRNFASGIKTAVALLSDEAKGIMPPESMEYFPLIINECDLINSLTKRLNLIFDTAPDGGKGTAGSVIERLLADVHDKFPAVDIALESSAEVLNMVMPAIESVRVALRETIHNAIEADRKKKIGLDYCCHNEFFCFRISDQGHGVPPEDYEKIFLPFYTTRSRHIGIGLTIARRLIAGVGGIITVCKNTHGGLTVEINIPTNSNTGVRSQESE